MTPRLKFPERLLALVLTALIALGPLAGCSSGPEPNAGSAARVEQQEAQAPEEERGQGAGEEAPPEPESAAVSAPFDLSQVPAYSGSPYVVVSGNAPSFTEEDRAAAPETYAPLDSLGRCGTAMVVVSRDTMPTEERGSIGMVKPSGWHTVRYDDLISDRYLYNRCHLIGYQLTGENANERNLITGTRYMNVEGMLPFENQIADYVERTGNCVLYRVAPVFGGDDLVARGVHMEAFSVEDGGAGVSFNVFCYNVQPGIGIDYATGESWREQQEAPAQAEQEPAEEATYVVNTNTGKFHLPGCRSVRQMKDANKKEVTATREEMVSWGYSPCANCNP